MCQCDLGLDNIGKEELKRVKDGVKLGEYGEMPERPVKRYEATVGKRRLLLGGKKKSQ